MKYTTLLWGISGNRNADVETCMYVIAAFLWNIKRYGYNQPIGL